MVDDLWPTGLRLWKTSPAWRYSVMAAILFTAMSLPHLLSGKGPGGPIPPPLAAYVKFYYGLYPTNSSFSYGGQSCETIMPLFRLVNRDDPQIAELRDRKLAIDNGKKCDAEIEASDRRFQALSIAMTAAGAAPTRAVLDEVIAGEKSLTVFDRSRPSEAAVLQKAQAFIQASDSRIADFIRDMEEFQRDPAPSAVAYRRVQEALQKIDADRDRMTSDTQHAALQTADSAVQKMRESAARFQSLGALLDDVRGGKDAAAQEKLIDATAAITPLDKTLATPQQIDQLRAALAVVMPLARNRLHQKLEALALENSPSPASYAAAAAAYGLVKDQPAEGLTDTQRGDLKQGELAAKKLDDSDARLRNLAAAADTWRSQGVTAGTSVLAPLRAMDIPFDKLRAAEASGPYPQAWDTLTQAEVILTASERGLNAATKSKTPIFVTSSRGSADDNKLVRAVQEGLAAAGFLIVDSSKFAALVVDLTVGKIKPEMTNNNGDLVSTTTLPVELRATWTGNNTPLALGENKIKGTSTSDESGEKEKEAFDNAADNVVEDFRKLTE